MNFLELVWQSLLLARAPTGILEARGELGWEAPGGDAGPCPAPNTS